MARRPNDPLLSREAHLAHVLIMAASGQDDALDGIAALPAHERNAVAMLFRGLEALTDGGCIEWDGTDPDDTVVGYVGFFYDPAPLFAALKFGNTQGEA